MTDISPALIRTVLAAEHSSQGFRPTTVLGWEVDWQNFLDEYPTIEGDAESWKQRLALAFGGPTSG